MSISKEADDILRKARKLIEDPKRWTKGFYARANGIETCSGNTNADCWCSMGAVNKVSLFCPQTVLAEVYTALRQTSHKIAGMCPENFNDLPSTTHADVLLMFSAARWQ